MSSTGTCPGAACAAVTPTLAFSSAGEPLAGPGRLSAWRGEGRPPLGRYGGLLGQLGGPEPEREDRSDPERRGARQRPAHGVGELPGDVEAQAGAPRGHDQRTARGARARRLQPVPAAVGGAERWRPPRMNGNRRNASRSGDAVVTPPGLSRRAPCFDARATAPLATGRTFAGHSASGGSMRYRTAFVGLRPPSATNRFTPHHTVGRYGRACASGASHHEPLPVRRRPGHQGHPQR